jgi:hypothetical protein
MIEPETLQRRLLRTLLCASSAINALLGCDVFEQN